ncbi:MAG: CHAD domain-containing protein [Bradyrhizobium sp.]|nr:CHAD domain-containing protein [Bradyrhizobium sp.]
MLRSTNSPSNAATRLKVPEAERPPSFSFRLNAAMPCDTAFRVIASRHLATLRGHQEATLGGDVDALHEMRVALTHLRAAIRLFSPMVDDAVRPRIWGELKWLNGKLGAVRDLDVAIEQIAAVNPKRPRAIQNSDSWHKKCADSHRQLAHSLRSARFRRLIAQTSAWITGGPWSTMTGKRTVKRRAAPVTVYGARKLSRWEKRLLRKGHKLRGMSARKRHRLRIFTKRLTCTIESFADVLEAKVLAKQKAALKPLRKAQRCLGQLNDDVKGQAIAQSLHRSGVSVPQRGLGPRRKKRLLRTAKKAYRKLAALKLAKD